MATFMIVNDDRFTRSFLGQCLLDLGHAVIPAASVHEARDLLRDPDVGPSIDCVFLDHELPFGNARMVGFDLLPDIKVPFVCCSQSAILYPGALFAIKANECIEILGSPLGEKWIEETILSRVSSRKPSRDVKASSVRKDEKTCSEVLRLG